MLADLLLLVPVGSQGSTMGVGPVNALIEIVRIVDTRFEGGYRHLDLLPGEANRCLPMKIDRSLPFPADESENSVD